MKVRARKDEVVYRSMEELTAELLPSGGVAGDRGSDDPVELGRRLAVESISLIEGALSDTRPTQRSRVPSAKASMGGARRRRK